MEYYIKVNTDNICTYPPLSISQMVESTALTQQREKINRFKRSETKDHPVLHAIGKSKHIKHERVYEENSEGEDYNFNTDFWSYSTHRDGIVLDELPPLSMSAGMRLLNKKDEARRVATGFNEEKSDKESVLSPRPRGVSYATLPGSVYPIEESDYGGSSESSYPVEERKPDLLARLRWRKAVNNLHRLKDMKRFNRRKRNKMIPPLSMPPCEERSRMLDEGKYDRWQVAKLRARPKATIGDVVIQLKGINGEELETEEEKAQKQDQIAKFITQQMFVKATTVTIDAGPTGEA